MAARLELLEAELEQTRQPSNRYQGKRVGGVRNRECGMRNSNTYARTGAVFYILWGLLHLYVAYDQLGFANQAGSADVRARLQQLASYIGAGAVATIAIAAIGNWRNRCLAYWLNLGIVSVFDIFYILLVVLKTNMPPLQAWAGPVLWIVATISSTIGFLTPKRDVEPRVEVKRPTA